MIARAAIHLPETPVVKRQIRTLKRCADEERQRQVTGGKKDTREQRADWPEPALGRWTRGPAMTMETMPTGQYLGPLV